MKSYDVTIQMKPLQQYFHMVLFVLYVVLTFESVDEILRCDQSNKSSFIVLSRGTISFSVNLFLIVENWHSREWREKLLIIPTSTSTLN